MEGVKPRIELEYVRSEGKEPRVMITRRKEHILFRVLEVSKSKGRISFRKKGREVVIKDWSLYIENEKVNENDKIQYIAMSKPTLSFKIQRNGTIQIPFIFKKSVNKPMRLEFQFFMKECILVNEGIFTTTPFHIRSYWYEQIRPLKTDVKEHVTFLEDRVRFLEKQLLKIQTHLGISSDEDGYEERID